MSEELTYSPSEEIYLLDEEIREREERDPNAKVNTGSMLKIQIRNRYNGYGFDFGCWNMTLRLGNNNDNTLLPDNLAKLESLNLFMKELINNVFENPRVGFRYKTSAYQILKLYDNGINN